ncbi:cobalamin B12-binding domain-containing protein [Nocardiopsis lambiniae]|uniref:Cobalamin-dependent protein n=1 Tax=Nocardiopsis lambiniae TaxID=3075539 RepID=A0ABU2M9B0_9ACTN|nr:cobalamin-dependent protein [Nocardiopsis sp. DSM 44743]MDT0329258.1 cobalamin-dependent protein [Nocardiopsis sp. DSM 44743]
MSGSAAEPHASGLDRTRDAYFEAVTAMDEATALDVVRRALARGDDPETLLLEVVAWAQRRVGRLWQTDDWSVAREHAATYMGERATALITEHATEAATPRGVVVVVCADGEWHSLPARLMGEVLRLRGWRVRFLGASVRTRHLALHLQEYSPDIVALSCSLPSRLIAAHGMIEAARRTGVPVIVGGAGFGADGTLAERMGASLWAATATEAADLLEKGPPFPVRRAPASLPFSDEYTPILRRRKALMGVCLRSAEEAHGGRGRVLEGPDLDRTVGELAHILDFLLAALYVGDDRVFTRFLEWTRVVMESHGAPWGHVVGVLVVLESELFDHPEAAGLVARGRAALRQG